MWLGKDFTYFVADVLGDDDDEDGTAEVDFAQWSLDYHVEPDEIIKQLVKEATAESESEAASTSDDAYVHETDGYAFISRKKDVDNGMSDRSAAAESHHVVASFGNSDMDDDIDELNRLLKSNPRIYKHCILEIEHYTISAAPLDHSIPRIYIDTNDRGRTFHGDDVVVKILSAVLLQSASDQSEKVWGKVVGVLKHMIDPKSRMFVCLVDNNSCGLMVPTDLAVPKISNLETQKRTKEERKRRICVYTITKQKKVKFSRFQVISHANDQTVFVVRFLSWKEGFRYPLGIVIGTVSAGTTAADALNILSIEYFVPQLYQTSTETQLNQLYPPSYKNFPPAAVKGRVDYRGSLVFTIDGPHTKDLDDALSVACHSDGSFTVKVHIADVAYFVEKGSDIDKEVHVRGTSHYPAIGHQTNMLPARLSEELCSLIRGVDRLTVTLSAKMSAEYVVQKVTVSRSVIRSQHRLTYSFVEDVLTSVDDLNPDCSQQLKSDILLLEKVARHLRYKRLGKSHSSLSTDVADFEHPRAGILVEELMIFANHRVATYLTSVYPSSTPIRVQSAPDSQELESWKEMFADEQKNMFALSPLLEDNAYHSESNDVSSSVAHKVLHPLWKAVVSESSKKEDNVEKLFEIIRNPTVHCQQAVAASYLRRLADKSKYVSSGEVPREHWRHCSQNLPVYTTFTSPLRRCVDLVVQRMLIAAMNRQPCPYSPSEIADICVRCSDTSVRGSGFEKASRMTSFCLQLQKRSTCSYAFVEKISTAKMSLNFPPVNFILSWSLDMPLSALKVRKAPVIVDGDLQLSWSQRLYELKPLQTAPRDTNDLLQIDADQHLVKLSSSSWQQMLRATLLRDAAALHTAINTAQKALLTAPSPRTRYAKDLTSEGKPVESKKQFCQYSLTLCQSSVLMVQLSVELHKSILRPCIQLLRLTPHTSICVEHNTKPVQCFATVPRQSAIKEHYSSPQLYKKLWLPLLHAESAVAALAEPSSAVIRNVKITWREEDGCQCGMFKISTLFCTERQIKFGKAEVANKFKRTVSHTSEKWQASSGYLCVQYGCNNITENAGLLAMIGSEVSSSSSSTEAVLWVGHCIVTDVFINSYKNFYEIHVRLSYSSSVFPDQLLTEDCPPATIEWLPKTLLDV